MTQKQINKLTKTARKHGMKATAELYDSVDMSTGTFGVTGAAHAPEPQPTRTTPMPTPHPHTLTLAMLKTAGACPEALKSLEATFGSSVVVTEALCASHATGVNWSWAASTLLSAPAWAEYTRVTAPAWAEYTRVTAPARGEAAAWDEYARVTAPAWDEYARVRAVTFARLWLSER